MKLCKQSEWYMKNCFKIWNEESERITEENQVAFECFLQSLKKLEKDI